ncbi:Lrp/AsnC family transcriptional regulator [Flavobacterium agricola]|uniref:Lrp/AsnC family transcriptional regulator n=1 Tax=Flavobacterium agricola TaxID=2870839 RepID=A0ABY6LWI7_9FLAO|nr:Lrp/AsnC family transcriptional regulator [Flavobacterium agricola]UYW00695.1 Lrp/AsnC family transcriptional regulator [Flavobacterium agricola]
MVQRLYDEGLIKAFQIAVDYEKLGYGLQVLVQIKFKNDDFKKFIAQLPNFPEIISCKRITGEYCLITECVLKNSAHLENLIDRILPFGIPTTSVQLSEIPVPKLFHHPNFK